MPNTKSAAKTMKTAAVKREKNQSTKRTLKTARKRVIDTVDDGNKEASVEQLQAFYSATDKAVKRGIITKNTAARRKSRMTKRVTALKGA